MSDPIWEKLNAHDQTMTELQLKHARVEERLAIMDERINRYQTDLMETLHRIEAKTDENAKWMNESRGGLRLGKWIAGIAAACSAGAVAWIEYFK